jgi:hypothetical protein
MIRETQELAETLKERRTMQELLAFVDEVEAAQ